jgi:hypothetical protein
MSFLTPLERKKIRTIDEGALSVGMWAKIAAYVNWIFGKRKVRLKRELWQIVENPYVLQNLLEKALYNRDMYKFFRGNVPGNDTPPGEKVEKIQNGFTKFCSSITSLRMPGEELDQIPLEIGSCGGLQSLDLSNNRISSLPPSMENLEQLQELRLGGNKLHQFLENCSRLRDLKALHLDSNLLEGLPPDMENLRLLTLNISFNPLTHFPSVLWRMTSLRSLHVSQDQYQKFRSEFKALLQTLPELRMKMEVDIPSGR